MFPDIRRIRARYRIVWEGGAFFSAHKNQALPVLWHAIVCRVQNVPRHADVVSCVVEGNHEFTQKFFVSAYRKPLDVFKHKRPRVKFCDDPHKFKHEAVPRIFEGSVSDQGKALTRRPAEHAVHCTATNTGSFPNVVHVQADDGTGNDRAIRKIELMGSTVDGIYLNSGADIEAGLLEP